MRLVFTLSSLTCFVLFLAAVVILQRMNRLLIEDVGLVARRSNVEVMTTAVMNAATDSDAFGGEEAWHQ